MSTLRFVSWNVRGVGSREKKVKIINRLNDLQADIVFLQETHVSRTSAHTLSSSQFPHMYSACYNSKQRGVAILINKRINFSIRNTMSDPEGRFIILSLSIQNIDLCIASIYGPNVDDPSFFHTFFTSLADHSDTTLVIGGDFNLVLNAEIDRLSTAVSQRNWQSADILKQYMKDFGLCDAWRSHHPTLRDYSFFSQVHHSHSCLDYFLVSSSMMTEITDTQIHPITISDHAAVSMSLTQKRVTPPTRNWRFNTSLLKEQDFINYFKRERAIYLEQNNLPEISPCVLWEAGKAVMRGKIISYCAQKKNKEKTLILELEQKIKSLENAYAASPQENIINSLRKLKLELNEILDKKTQFMLQRLRLENFEHGNKSGKFLANQLKLNKEKTAIHSIKDSVGNITHDPQQINNSFKDFYEALYSSQINPSDAETEEFLNDINLPKLNEDQITTLDSPFSSSEFYKAIQHLPNNKAPGPDGFPAEFYKEFWPVLEPTFFRMVTQIKNNHTISPNMNSANISLLLKPGKDPTLPSSYRPISLINVDLKIICKVLARRLEKITPYIIHSDQTGFIKGRHSADNTRRLINIIDYCSINKLEKIVVSLDAEKAFDRVNWKFLLAVLHKFGFGPSFINWIETLYSSPNARVRTNDLISQSFSLQRGTRQGCPLSPSMFIIFIEPLAAKIRQNVNIKGIQTENTDHKISLYADDVLLFLGNSQTALLKTITLIDKFSSVSDYSINWSKSTVLPLNCKFQNIITTSLQSGNIRYLGINFSPRLSDLVRLNHIPLLKTIEDDLTRWNSLPISLMGRVATIKMMILPKVNYLFLMIPNKPSIAWFKSLDSYISKFLWKSKTSRISLKTLQKLKCSGGLELPNFYHYFLANRLRYVSRWMKSNRSGSPWLDLEQTLCGKLKISDLPLISSSIKHYNCFKSLTISITLIAWWEFLKMAKSSLIPCKLTPIWNNPDICRKKTVLNFSEWQEKGINNLEHVIHDGTFISSEDLILKYEISTGGWGWAGGFGCLMALGLEMGAAALRFLCAGPVVDGGGPGCVRSRSWGGDLGTRGGGCWPHPGGWPPLCGPGCGVWGLGAWGRPSPVWAPPCTGGVCAPLGAPPGGGGSGARRGVCLAFQDSGCLPGGGVGHSSRGTTT
uniref:Reverse transcriptase domain-containing protein n=1 Tax=Pygocentrus nattereri TaxID=42514 RepID=A0AAR2JRJ2_PYGNA